LRRGVTLGLQLGEWRKQYAAHKEHLDKGGTKESAPSKPSAISLSRQLTRLKHSDPERAWLTEVPAAILYPALEDLESGYRNWWRSLKAGNTQFRAPVRKKLSERGSFSFSNQALTIGDFRIKLPKIGWIRTRENPRWHGKIKTCTVSTDGARWYLSITIETEAELPPIEHLHQGTVGVDLGVRTLATYVKPDGELVEVEGPKALRQALRRIKHEGRNLSRKQGPDRRTSIKASANWKKQKRKLGRLHAKVATIRENALHQLSHDLTSTYDEIAIEDLHVKGMMRNRHLAQSIGDAGFGEFRRQIEYKAANRGIKVTVADRFFASSKICSECGTKNEQLRLSERRWTCPECGHHHHRDGNASINLVAEAAKMQGSVRPPSQPVEG
jgi:putative transposase